MPVIAVNLIKVAFVAALYGFLLYIARSMRGHVAGPPSETTAATSKSHTARTEDETPPALPGERSVEVFDASGGAVRHVIRDTTIIGRGSSADIRIVDDFASDRHASLLLRGTRLIVEDLDSTNGTTIDGKPLIGATEVTSGTTLVIGRTKVVVK
jgi:pSer/pThr/pTyr-binding forkhead associated (FHA) protein